MKRRFGTAPAHGTAEATRLAWWLVLVGVLAVLGYATRFTSGKPDPQVLYEWSSVAGAVIQDAIVLVLVLWIAGFSTARLALRQPVSWRLAAKLVGAAILAIYAFELVYTAIVNPGNEQGLTPSHWEPHHWVAYVANAVVICTWVPFVEELTFRGLGYTLLEPFGRWPAIVVVGIVFGLAHGLVLDFPIIAVFGMTLAWIRSRVDSVVPGMVVHGLFNAVALIAAVTIHN
ncbi:MAG TPA: CPBP family intramembrane glutamic endopeptidase [Gaiellaceae bacterium]|nr:CPBP family intramembrane glutamic endopeptidase [Gaiellaceae bacterium]